MTEEPKDTINEKLSYAGLDKAGVAFSYDLAKIEVWEDKVTQVVRWARDDGHKVIYWDNLSRAAQIEDENGTALARAFETLSDEAKRHSIAVIGDVHFRKSRGSVEDLFRGGTAIVGATENNIGIERVGGHESRKRRFSSFGRTSTTRWRVEAALSDDYREYQIIDTQADDDLSALDRERIESLREFAEGVTAAEFAQLIGRQDDAARNWLNENADRVPESHPQRYTAPQPEPAI